MKDNVSGCLFSEHSVASLRTLSVKIVVRKQNQLSSQDESTLVEWTGNSRLSNTQPSGDMSGVHAIHP